MPEVINFDLNCEVKYAHNGEETIAKFIELSPPTFKQLDRCAPLKQAFFRAVSQTRDMATTEGETETDIEDMEPENIAQLIYTSDEDATKFLLHGVELLKSGIAKVEGTEKVTQPIIDQLSLDEIEKLIGTYMLNFILASVLNSQ